MYSYSFQKWLDKSERRSRQRIAMVVLPGLIGAGLLLYKMLMIRYYNYEKYDIIVNMAIIFSFAVSGFGLLMIYLQTGFKRLSTRDHMFNEISCEVGNIIDGSNVEELEKQKEEIQKKGVSLSQLNQEQMDSLVNELTENIKTEASINLLNEIKEQVSKEVLHKDCIESIEKIFKNTLDRLNLELLALSRRGNLNLSIGVLITIIGLFVLGYYVFQSKIDSSDPWFFTAHFLPRLTLVLFIEVFAYFFLKLYKSSLAEIKYFQNEMTNVEARYISIIAATKSSNDNIWVDVVKNLTNTERNFILNKGQTTIELEKAKLDQNDFPEIGNKILEIINKKSK